MFNIGPMELIVILLVALIVVGPKRLPEVGRSIGKSLRELRIAEVSELDLQIENGAVRAYRAKVKVSFKYTGGD